MRLYRNNLKNRNFGKKAPQDFDPERATIAQRQGASEDLNSEVKPTRPKIDFSGRFGIIFFCAILLLCKGTTACSFELSSEEATKIGKQIYQNECSGKKERLVWWNDGENFASLGIGHFIWYPVGARGPFEEIFPELVTFFAQQNVKIPEWLETAQGCPWNSKKEFLAAQNMSQKRELENLLEQTMAEQTLFIVKRLEKVMPAVLASFEEPERLHIANKLEQLENSFAGKFALIDYLNFKGNGLIETECYNGQGWGLKQVLQQMPETSNAALAFAETAKTLLKKRVQNAPPERHEERWLPGWLARIDRYLKS